MVLRLLLTARPFVTDERVMLTAREAALDEPPTVAHPPQHHFIALHVDADQYHRDRQRKCEDTAGGKNQQDCTGGQSLPRGYSRVEERARFKDATFE